MHRLREKLLAALALHWRTIAIWAALGLLTFAGMVGTYIDLHLAE